MSATQKSVATSTPIIRSPLIRKTSRKCSIPTPLFAENLSYSSKRDRRELEITPEPSKPRPRIQSVSRCFKRSLFSGPQVIGGIDEVSFLSTPGYSDKAKQTYLQQCFSITNMLGEGSFGKVYKCREKGTGVEYAVKVSDVYNARAVDEVHKHEALSVHPNCVKFYKAWEERRRLYIQMELCDESLGSFVRRLHSKLNEAEIWRVLQHSLAGLEHFHRNDLLHMDIKPDNIFRCVTPNSVVYKLGDFGLSVTVNDLNTTDLMEGDSKYLALELLDGRCDEKADIFSVGISVLELMAEVVLPNNGAMWHDLRNGRLPPTPGYSSSLRGIVFEMMDRDPDRRPDLSTLLNKPSHKYYSWLNFVKDKGSSVISSLWGSIVKKQSDSVGEDTDHDDLLKHMEDMEEIEINAPQITPILSKKLNVNSPRCSPNISAPGLTTPLRGSPVCRNSPQCWPVLNGSPQVWPGSPCLSPVRANRSHQSILCMSNKLESSTPIKSYAFDESELDELEEGDIFEKPSLIKRNLLDSFDDQEDDDF